ncbi:hypothetical protein GPUN_0725 [Glaciecola punicea ACAM 611]|uniref:Uncharacterized protein n=1 Tax=Glaciecola punicea ACAM 611 TaxID=1121923 RepID=H5T987_9ALTE|nr:hypothetical protein GPUN_0725 [Glaciecola punicea ACAM 611]
MRNEHARLYNYFKTPMLVEGTCFIADFKAFYFLKRYKRIRFWPCLRSLIFNILFTNSTKKSAKTVIILME